MTGAVANTAYKQMLAFTAAAATTTTAATTTSCPKSGCTELSSITFESIVY